MQQEERDREIAVRLFGCADVPPEPLIPDPRELRQNDVFCTRCGVRMQISVATIWMLTGVPLLPDRTYISVRGCSHCTGYYRNPVATTIPLIQ